MPDGDAFVSTVWLGLDHGFGETVRPLIFETMVFAGTWLTGAMRHFDDLGLQLRYSTEAEALAGHRAVLAACMAALGQHYSVGDLKAVINAAGSRAFALSNADPAEVPEHEQDQKQDDDPHDRPAANRPDRDRLSDGDDQPHDDE